MSIEKPKERILLIPLDTLDKLEIEIKTLKDIPLEQKKQMAVKDLSFFEFMDYVNLSDDFRDISIEEVHCEWYTEKPKIYITHLTYQELNELPQEVVDVLVEANIIHYTDYETTEILADDVQELDNRIKNSVIRNEEVDQNDVEILNILKDYIGTDIVDLLINDEIDLVQIV